MKIILIALLLSSVAEAQQTRPPITLDRLKADKPLVEQAIEKSERYYQDFLLLPNTAENREKAARMKAKNVQARARLKAVEAGIVSRTTTP